MSTCCFSSSGVSAARQSYTPVCEPTCCCGLPCCICCCSVVSTCCFPSSCVPAARQSYTPVHVPAGCCGLRQAVQEAPNQANLLCNLQIGSTRIYLDAAHEAACQVWKSPSLGFTVIEEATFMELHTQYTLLHNIRQNGLERCIKLIPATAESLDQVFNSLRPLLREMCPTSTACLPPPCLPLQHLPKPCHFSTHQAGGIHLIPLSSGCYMQEQPQL